MRRSAAFGSSSKPAAQDSVHDFTAYYLRTCNNSSRTIDSVDVRIKRVYEPQDSQDGKRILVDRLWPRGLTKEKAAVDVWLKDIAPSTELRKWFGHDPARWSEFQKRYRDELKKNVDSVSVLRQEAKSGSVTLLFGAKDEEHNEAVVLRSILKR
jgi:uncharacterized protein YeaO (DUF488 family)